MRSKSFSLLTLACCTLTGVATGNAQTREGFVQDRFAIGYWVTPPADERIEERFQEIADANFTVIIAGYNPPGTAEKELEMVRKHDLRALFWIADEATFNAPEVWGKVIKDEPNASTFPEWKAKSDEFKAVHPDKLAYMNLYPNYASQKQLGTDTYEEHVSQYMQVLQPEVLSMDHYPRFIPGNDTRDSYCENLEVMRKHSLEAGIPFWNYFNVMPYGPHTDPTESQIRWQVYSSLAYGAKGIFYFCYYTPSSNEFPRGGAIIDRNGRKTRHYDQARRINAEVKNLGPTLMQLTSDGVRRIKGHESGDTLNGTLIQSVTNTYSPDAPFDLQVGEFTHEDGRKAALIQNYHFAYTAWITVEFDGSADSIVEIDRATGEEIPVYDESPGMEGIQISFDAGDGRLFIAKP